MELPKQKTKATRVNPSNMVIFSQPKIGKTTAISHLDNCLIIDLEKGSQFVDALKYDVIGVAKKEKTLPIIILKKLIKAIKISNEEKKGYTYKYIAIDTVTALEEIVMPYACQLYKNTPMGKNWQGNDVTTLPQGAGYGYLRTALSNILDELNEICETLIILGHVKDKLVEKEGKEMNERGLALIGKTSSILCSQVDAVGYMYRNDENETIINFAASESLLSGARSKHLRGQEIVLSEAEDKGEKFHWNKIFLD